MDKGLDEVYVTKDTIIEEEGWFVPQIHKKKLFVASDRRSEIKRNLGVHCMNWLKENFKIDGIIKKIKILDEEEIDKTLNLVCLQFNFVCSDGMEGESVAFLEKNLVQPIPLSNYISHEYKLNNDSHRSVDQSLA